MQLVIVLSWKSDGLVLTLSPKEEGYLMVTKSELLSILQRGPGERPLEDFVDHFTPGAFETPAQLSTRVARALREIPGCVRGAHRSVVYLPLFRTGATMIQPFPAGPCPVGGGEEVIVWLPEVLDFFNPTHAPTITFRLSVDLGKTYRLTWRRSFESGPSIPLDLATWLLHQQQSGDYDALEIQCVDGARGYFRIWPIRMDQEDRTDADARLRKIALAVLARPMQGVKLMDIAGRVLAQGPYHAAISPHPLATVLALPEPSVRLSPLPFGIQRLPEIPPNLSQFLSRYDPEWAIDQESYWHQSGGLLYPTPEASLAVSEGVGRYTIRITLSDHAVAWTLVIGGSHTFYDLHREILSAAGFDDDHLWLFSLLGDPEDSTLSIGPDEMDDVLCEASVTLGEVGLMVGQRFSYVFDMGDWWVFELQVIDFTPGESVVSPCIVDQQGTPPDQYPDDWVDELDDEEPTE